MWTVCIFLWNVMSYFLLKIKNIQVSSSVIVISDTTRYYTVSIYIRNKDWMWNNVDPDWSTLFGRKQHHY